MIPGVVVDSFLAGFFGEGNDLSLAALAEDAPELAAWLSERLIQLQQDPGAAHVLPRRHLGTTRWYGLAHSSRQLRELAQALSALMVPTYARFDRHEAINPADPVDAAVIEFTGGNALVLEVIPGQQQQVRRALELFNALDMQRPQRQLVLSRPLGRLLREFEMAVLADAGDNSEELLREIERSGQLSAQNAVFLRMRRLAGLRRFDELLRLPELTTVLAIRRPARVSASLLEAVYATELARYEADDDPSGALRHFADVVLRKYPALFKSRHGLLTPEAIKSFVLHALVVRPEDAESRAALIASPDLSPAELRFLEHFASLAEAPTHVDTLVDAVTAVHAGDFDAALRIASGQTPSVERAELLIRCAFEIDSINAMKIAATAVDGLIADQRDGLITSRWYAGPWAHITESLSGEAGKAAIEIPASWPRWFELVVEGPGILNALEIAERAVVEWSVEDFSAQDGRTVAGLLSHNMTPQAMRLIKDALPHFLQFIERADESTSHHRELLDDIAVLLMAEEELGVADVQVVVNIVGSLLEAGLSADRYRQLIEDFSDLWEQVDSPVHLDAAIDMLDVLMMQACPNPRARAEFFYKLVGSFQRWRRRIRLDQWALLGDLASELGASEVVRAVCPREDEADGSPAELPRDALAGMTVAFYTLTETAGTRAREFVNRNFDDVVVEVSKDHVASERLRALARAADIFVVATRSAKHAATTFIGAQRPPGLPLVYATGKGSASLLRALFSCISP